MNEKNQIQTASGINIAAGVWMLFSPFILGFAAISAAVMNNAILGIVIAVMALIRVTNPQKTNGLSIINAILGLWLIISPFAFGFTSAVIVWNNVILGIIVTAMAVWSASTSKQTSHAV